MSLGLQPRTPSLQTGHPRALFPGPESAGNHCVPPPSWRTRALHGITQQLQTGPLAGLEREVVERGLVLEAFQGLNLSPTIAKLCDPGQVTFPLCASISSSLGWGEWQSLPPSWGFNEEYIVDAVRSLSPAQGGDSISGHGLSSWEPRNLFSKN